MDFRVVSDSSCDISPEQEKTYEIGIIPYYVSFDGETYHKERTEITAEEFYRQMAGRKTETAAHKRKKNETCHFGNKKH